MHRKRAQRILGILKKSVEFQGRRKTVDFRVRPEALWRVPLMMGVGGADGKARIERMCISLPYAETSNSKVIKGFVPELRSRCVFFVFQDFYVLCIYVMNILCTFHVSGDMAMVQLCHWHFHKLYPIIKCFLFKAVNPVTLYQRSWRCNNCWYILP